MQRGVDASETLRSLLRERGWKIVDLARATGIAAGTLTAYATQNPEARRRLGLANGQKIAHAFDCELSRLGLAAEAEAVGELAQLRLALEALKETVRLLTLRVTALEQRAPSVRSRKAA